VGVTINRPDEYSAPRGLDRRSNFFVPNLTLVDHHEAPLLSLVTEWIPTADNAFAPAAGNGPSGGESRSALSFAADQMSPTREGALTLLLRFAREQVTQLSAFLARLDEEILLSEDSQVMSSARLRPDGNWELRCAKCKGIVRCSKSARDVACEKCRRLLIRDAASLREDGEYAKSRTVYCLTELPAEFAERAIPDAFVLAFVERDAGTFSPAGDRPDAGGNYSTVKAGDLPGQRHASRHSALAAMREIVQKRLTSLSKQRARLAREIS
jgi:hypothetical protein